MVSVLLSEKHIASTISQQAGLCIDIGYLMHQGTTVMLAQVLAMMSLIPGSGLFIAATMFVYPSYLVNFGSQRLAPIPNLFAFLIQTPQCFLCRHRWIHSVDAPY